MQQDYSKEQLWKIVDILPQELKHSIFSEDTADAISEACEKNDIEDQRVSEVARYTGRVLMGILLPKDFEIALREKVGLSGEVAKNITSDISRLVFFPVKDAISDLHTRKARPIAKNSTLDAQKEKTVEPTTKEAEEEQEKVINYSETDETETEEPSAEEKAEVPRRTGPDRYREEVE